MQQGKQRVLSIRQPFAEMILRGLKEAEYRSRPTNFRGRTFIYATKYFDGNFDTLQRRHGLPEDLPRGVIVGAVDVVACDPLQCGEEYAWMLRNPERFSVCPRFTGMPQPAFWFASLSPGS
jgi:hypothetical protein